MRSHKRAFLEDDTARVIEFAASLPECACDAGRYKPAFRSFLAQARSEGVLLFSFVLACFSTTGFVKHSKRVPQGGFDWACMHAMGANVNRIGCLFGLQNIPWICRIDEYG